MVITPKVKNIIGLATVIFVVILIAVISHWHWFNADSIVSYGDWGFLYSEQYKEISVAPQAWTPSSLGSSDIVGPARYPLNLARKLLSAIAPELAIEKLLVLYPFLLINTVVVFFFLYHLTGSKAGAFVGSTVMTYNTYVLTTGNMTFLTALAVGLIVLWLFILTLWQASWRLSILTGVFAFITSLYEFRAFYIVAWILLGYLLYFLVVNSNKLNFRKIVLLCSLSLMPILVVGLINFYWLLGLQQMRVLTTNDIFARPLFGDNFFNVTNSFTLFQAFWTSGEFFAFIVQPIPFYFWLLPLFAFAGLLVNRKNKDVLFFGLLALIGIFLTKQSGNPFPTFYQRLYDFLPGFNAFREASKFYYLIALGYAVLLSSFVAWIWKRPTKSYGILLGQLSLTSVILTLLLINAKPLITQEIGQLFVPRHIHQDYLVLKDFILAQNEFFRTLWVPTDSRWSIYTSQKPKISTVSILDRNWKDYVWLRWGYQQLSRNEKIAALFNINGANELLDNSVIKYVIVPIQDFANDDDFFIHYGGRENPNIRQWYIDQLDQLPYLKKIDIGTQELVVYENEGYKPYITTSPDLATITNLSSLDDKYSYVTNQLSQEFLFTETVKDEQGNNSQTILPSTFFQSIYEDLTPDNITADKIRVTIKPPFANNSLYANNAWQDLPARDEHVFEYDLPEGMGMNIIPNASLENGLWPAPPTKCLDHDRTGLLQSRVDEDIASEGDKSLLVKSTSETACAGLGPLPVKATSSYLLSFDYQADNENVAGYRLDFDQGKDVDELLPAPVSDWQKFNQLITIPHNATNLTLFVYSYADEDNRYKTVRYDNFRLMQIPDLHDKFYFVSTTGKQLQNPAKVDFEIIMPTKKLARIKSATTPFYLNMSESYHDQWRLMMDNDKVRGKLASWVPWAVPDAIANEHHYKLNSFLNGWYVDTNELCVRQNLCRQNADGSYDMDMVIEFWPQRWFYLGLIISGATLVGCLGYLSYAGGRVIFKKYFS